MGHIKFLKTVKSILLIKKATIFAEIVANNSSNNNFPKRFLNNLINREKENIPLDSKLQDPKLGFNLPFTKQELVEGFKNRKGTATAIQIYLYLSTTYAGKHPRHSWICLILSGSKDMFPFNGRR